MSNFTRKETNSAAMVTYTFKTNENATNKTRLYFKRTVLSVLFLGLIVFNIASLYQNAFFTIDFKLKEKFSCSEKINVYLLKQDSGNNALPAPIDIVFFGKYAYRNMKIIRGIVRTTDSMMNNTKSPLYFHVLLDMSSITRVNRALRKVARKHSRKLNVTYYDVEEMANNYRTIINTMKKYFFWKDVGRYNDDIFFMSEIFHLAFPTLEKIIFLDTDLKFLADIKELHDEFHKFKKSNVIGIAPDLQPQYRVDFKNFRMKNPKTPVGSQRPGRQGFNTGVTLFDLEKMRESKLYKTILNDSVINDLCDKYQFKGYLGHQDFFTLTGMEYPQLYHELDCSWNRQLDSGWRKNVGALLFDLYHSCFGKIKIYHGNGDAIIPDD